VVVVGLFGFEIESGLTRKKNERKENHPTCSTQLLMLCNEANILRMLIVFRVLIGLAVVGLHFCLVFTSNNTSQVHSKTLRFRSDGTFKIVQVL
jgi:hypothetical protein